jgi:hypothetical protein
MDKNVIKHLADNPNEIHKLSSREFEEMVAEVLSGLNWNVNLTPPTRDGGYDILGISTDLTKLETSWIVECKKYSPDRKIGIEVLRQLYGTKEYLKITNGIIVTTSQFSIESKKFAQLRDDIKLVDFDFLTQWLKAYKAPEDGTTHLEQNAFHSCFISHSHKDHEFAEFLTAKLRENNIKTWFAPDDLHPGQKIHEEIQKAISLFDKLIIILSKNSMKSEWVITEIRRERERSRKRREFFFQLHFVPLTK